MFDEPTEGKNITTGPSLKSPTASGDNTVDLFPALADRRMMPINSIRQPVSVKQGTQISTFNPVSFDEALDIVECLRARAATTITLDNMKKIDASRLVDFVAGASSALSGSFHKLSEQVYLFCPANIKISVPSKPVETKSTERNPSLDFLYPSDIQSMKIWSSSRPATI
jgi:FtsZ-interacting cell division protein YlmF